MRILQSNLYPIKVFFISHSIETGFIYFFQKKKHFFQKKNIFSKKKQIQYNEISDKENLDFLSMLV